MTRTRTNVPNLVSQERYYGPGDRILAGDGPLGLAYRVGSTTPLSIWKESEPVAAAVALKAARRG